MTTRATVTGTLGSVVRTTVVTVTVPPADFTISASPDAVGIVAWRIGDLHDHHDPGRLARHRRALRAVVAPAGRA